MRAATVVIVLDCHSTGLQRAQHVTSVTRPWKSGINGVKMAETEINPSSLQWLEEGGTVIQYSARADAFAREPAAASALLAH